MNAQTIQSALNQVHLACVGFIPTEVSIPYTTSYKTEPLRHYSRSETRKKTKCKPWTQDEEDYLVRCVHARMMLKYITIDGRSMKSIKAKIQWIRDQGRLNYVNKNGAQK